MSLVIDAGFESLPSELNKWSTGGEELFITKEEAEIVLELMQTQWQEHGAVSGDVLALLDKIKTQYPDLAQEDWVVALTN